MHTAFSVISFWTFIPDYINDLNIIQSMNKNIIEQPHPIMPFPNEFNASPVFSNLLARSRALAALWVLLLIDPSGFSPGYVILMPQFGQILSPLRANLHFKQ